MIENPKIITIGDTSVGKTALIRRCKNNTFDENEVNTVGVDFFRYKENIDNNEVEFFLWDTAGQERFRAMFTSYFKTASGVLLVFSVTDSQSFQNLPEWINMANECSVGVPFVLVGNKKDLEDQREVSAEEAQNFAEQNQMTYFEVSAKTGDSVNDAFHELLELAYHFFLDSKKENSPQIQKLEPAVNDGKSGCSC